MADKVDPQVVDAVASSNFKTIGEGPAFFQNMGFANALSHQNRLNLLAETAIASAIRSVATTPGEEASADATTKATDLPALISLLLAALSSNQQAAKVAQSTPPDSGK